MYNIAGILHSDSFSIFENYFPLQVFVLFCFLLFTAAPAAYESSQARGRIVAAAASLHHSQSNMGSEPQLCPTPQL